MQNESQNIEYKESWGRGFKKIAEEFERASLPLPTIEENGGGVMAIVQRKTIDEVIAERGGDVGVNVGVNVGVKLSARERDLLELLRLDGTLTAARIAETYSISTRQAERLLTGLKKKGFLVRKGSDKAGHWEVVS